MFIQTETPIPNRDEDSHDILGTYKLLSNWKTCMPHRIQNPINGNEFIVKINYQWSKNSNPSKVNSKFDNLKFVLDNDNKIIEVSSLN